MKTTLQNENRGRIARRVVAPLPEASTVPCVTCSGTGRRMDLPKHCGICQGRGWLTLPKVGNDSPILHFAI